MVGGGADDTRRGTRSPSPGRARAPPRTPASPAAAAAGSAARVPVPPDSPEGGDEGALRERLNDVAGRLVGLEASVQGLQQGAQAALAELLTRARDEFAAQRNSLVALRSDVQQEASTLRTYLEETRMATEHLYAGASSGFATLQGQVQGHGRELQRLASLAAAGHGGAAAAAAAAPAAAGPAPAPGSPDPPSGCRP